MADTTLYVTGIAPAAEIVINGVSDVQQITATGSVAVAGPAGADGQDGVSTGGGTGVWGAITGTLTDQTDLQTALDTKLTKTSNLSDLPNKVTARTNLGVAVGTDVQAQITGTTSSDYYRGDKTFANLNTAIRTNRLNELAVPNAAVNMAAQRVTNAANPTSAQDVATKTYVDSVVTGLKVKASVIAATTAALATSTYASSVITASANGALTIDDVTVATDDRVLIKDQVTAKNNGIYTVTDTGDASHPFILTRATDMDSSDEIAGAFTFVVSGTLNGSSGFIVSGSGPFTLDTTAIPFTQFSTDSTPDATTLVKGKALLGAAGGAATFEADALKIALSYLDTDGTFAANSDTKIATQKAAKTYVDSSVAASNPDATTSAKGKVKLAGDLGGTAALPTIKRTSRFIVAPYGDTRPADYTCAGASNNNVEINAAIVAANALPNGGRVELLDGTFVTSASILRLPNVHIMGAGMGITKVTVASGGNYNVFDMNKVTYDNTNPMVNSHISDMEIDCSNLSPTSATKCINGGNFKYCKIYRVYAHDSTATGIGDDDFYGTTIDQVIVENCGYSNKKVISGASWASNVFTFTTASAHGYTAWVQATGTLTASGSISDGETVTIGGVVYTFKTTLTGAAYEVLINGSAANALVNLKAAINLTGTIGTDYGTGTLKNTVASGGTITSTTLALTAINYGTSGNAVATTETGANLAFGATTLSGGVSGSKIVITGMVPVLYNGSFNVVSVPDSTHFTVSGTNNLGQLNLGSDPGTPTTFGLSSDQLIGHNGIGIASGSLTNEACIVTNSICIGNQNNNFLIEADYNNSGAEVSYIFSNCISINAGTTGFRNTGSLNAQFSNCFDYGSPTGAVAASVASNRTITAASWSGGVVTFTVTAAYLFVAGQKVQISGMVPTAYNGWYTVQSIPTSTTFTINLTSDPGTALTMGSSSFEVHPVDGSSFNDFISSNNLNYGLILPNDGVIASNPVIKNSWNYGIKVNSASNCRIEECRVYNNGRQGIQVIMGSGIYEPMDHTTITGHVYNNGQRYANCDGIDIDPSVTSAAIQNLTIDVHAFDNQETKTQRYGVILRSGGTMTNVLVKGNLSGNATAPILVQNTSSSIYVDGVIGVNPNGPVNMGNIGGSTTFDVSLNNLFVATLTSNLTAVMTSPPIGGARMTWILQQDATGGRTISLPANANVQTTLTLSTAASAVDILTWTYDAVAGKWRLTGKLLGNTGIGTLNNLVITTSNGNNTVSLNLTQNDTTNNPDGADITNAGTGHGLKVLQSGILAANKYGLFIDSSAIQVNSPLARFRQNSASATSDTVQLDNAGTGNALLVNTGNVKLTGGVNIVLGSSTGTMIGTTTTGKLAFFGSTPIVQPSAATDLGTVLSNLGLRAAGGAYPITTSAAVSLGSLALTTALSIANGGTGATTQAGAANAILPTQTSNSGKYLTTDGSNASWASVPSITYGSGLLDYTRKQPFLYSDFLATGSSSSDPFLGVAIASGTVNTPGVTPTTHHPGLARFRTSTTTNSGYYIGTNSSQLLLGGGEVFEAVFEVDTLSNSTFRIGFHNTSTSADAVDGVYLEIASTGVATGKTANNSTRSSTGSTYTISTATYYRCKIVVTSTSSVTYYLYNDAGTQLWTDTLTTNIPSARATGAGVNGTNTGTTAIDLLHLDYLAVTWSSDRTR